MSKKKELELIRQLMEQDQYEIINLFALIDATKFATKYLGTKEFEVEKQKFNYDVSLLKVGLSKSNVYLMQRIMYLLSSINECREELGLKRLSTDMEKLYIQILDVVEGRYDSDEEDSDIDNLNMNLGNNKPTMH